MSDKMPNEPMFLAAVDMIGRTGMSDFQIRYSDDVDPIVWIAVCFLTEEVWQCAAGRNPLDAVLRLCTELIDGGQCSYCNRPTGFDPDNLEPITPPEGLLCWYRWDPELATFRRSCEGMT